MIDAEVIAAGTGTSAHIKRIMELIKEKAYAPHFLVPRNVADVAEESASELSERYGRHFDVSVLLGVYCKLTPKGADEPSAFGLYYIHPPGIAGAVDDYFAIGSGGPFASYLLHRLHDETNPTTKLNLDAAIYEAVWVIEETKKVQLHCGGDVQLACIRNGKVHRKTRRELQTIIAELQEADDKVKKTQREIMKKAK